jgi:hypothetical protein
MYLDDIYDIDMFQFNQVSDKFCNTDGVQNKIRHILSNSARFGPVLAIAASLICLT